MARCHISDDRKRDAALVRRTQTIARTASMLDMSESTVKRAMRNMRQNGQPSRPAHTSGRRRKLGHAEVMFLEGCVERKPDMYLFELQAELRSICGVEVSENTISRSLRRRGYVQKQVSRSAGEANPAKQAEYLATYAAFYNAQQLIFVDESHCNRFTTQRKLAWAPLGERARRQDYFVRGQRYSILPALSLDGVLHMHIQDHSYTGNEFLHFIDALLDHMNPYPQPNSVIVMDNASIHKSRDLQDMVEARGMHVLYLPSYSPHLNPIEEGFSAVKAWIRRHRADVIDALDDGADPHEPYHILSEAVTAALTPENAYGWFRHAGYVEDDNE